MLIDLDGFKGVNDTHGHAAGDLLLRTVARRVRRVVREEDTVARLGGDELAVLALGLVSSSDLLDVAERIVAAIAEPVDLGDAVLLAGGSVGIAWSPSGDAAFDEIVATADRAMYAAKRDGGGRYQLFSMPPRARRAA